MTIPTTLPDGLEPVRTTPWFSTDDVPRGLCREHQLAAQVWGRLVVANGSLRLVFDHLDTPPASIAAGDSAIIPPERRHHVELGPDATFAIEILRAGSPR